MIFQKLLEEFKRANKGRKSTLANKYGFSSIEDYLTYLNSQIENTKEKVTENLIEPLKEVQKVHKVNIVDCSGSMWGDKINSINKFLKQEIEELKKSTVVDYIYSIVYFSSNNKIGYKIKQSPINEVVFENLETEGLTALYDAIGFVFQDFKDKTEKILINIYTDGEENNSVKFNSSQIRELIKKYDNITCTFVGTKVDVERIKVDLGIDDSNTLVHNNTGEGIKQAVLATVTATQSYSEKVSKGEDVKRGFYKKLN